MPAELLVELQMEMSWFSGLPLNLHPQRQGTVFAEYRYGNIEKVSVRGRHYLAIAIRVPPVLEAITAIVLADLVMIAKKGY